MRNFRKIIFAISAALLLGSCNPMLGVLYNVNQQFSLIRPLTLEEVKVSITKALALKSWRVVNYQPGVILAEIQVSVHFATIKINYSTSTYAITLVDSSPGLKYDDQGNRQVIHRRYNNWINQLDHAIYNELIQTAVRPPQPISPQPISPQPISPSSPEPKTPIIKTPPPQTSQEAPTETTPVQIPQELSQETTPAQQP